MEDIAENYNNTQMLENINPRNLLAQYARSHEQILSDEKKLPILTDLDPWLEYYFFNTPERIPVWPKGDTREEFLNRIVGCDSACRSEIFEGGTNSAE
jgi:hypothetical protein